MMPTKKEDYVFNRYKGTLLMIMRDTKSSESERKEASRLYMLPMITRAQEAWVNKFVKKFKK